MILPNLIKDQLSEIICLDELNFLQKKTLIISIMGYSIKAIPYNELSKRLKFLKREQLSEIKCLCLDAYEVCIFKCVIYKILKENIIDKNIQKSVFKSYGLSYKEYNLYSLLKKEGIIDKCMKNLSSVKIIYDKNLIKENCTRLVDEIEIWIKKFAKRKLSYIAKYQNLDIDDLIGDLRTKAIQSYYQIIPFVDTYEHSRNYVKRSIHNNGINIIHAANAKKRARLVEEGGGYNSLFSNIHINREGDDISSVHPALVFNNTSNLELKISVKNIIKKYNYNKKYKEIIELLMMKDKNDFIKKCSKQYKRIFSSSEDIYNHTGHVIYNDLVRSHIDIPKIEYNNFIKIIKTSLI